MARRGIEDFHSLKAVSNNAGAGKDGLAVLVESGQINDLIISFLGSNKALEKKYLTGEISIELCPQGSIAERLRAGGAGIPAFYTPTGVSKLIIFVVYPFDRARGEERANASTAVLSISAFSCSRVSALNSLAIRRTNIFPLKTL